MATELFVDSSAWFPIADGRHPDHRRLARVLRERRRGGARFLTTNLVVAETHALLLRRVHRDAALAFVRQVAHVADLVVRSTPDLEAHAVHDWLEPFGDQDFSFADAVSFAVMAERGIRDALALDHHFAVAGFALVPAGR